MSRTRSLILLSVASLALLGAVPTVLDTKGLGAGTVINEVESCAQAQAWETNRVGGKLLKVAAPGANLTFSPLGLGGSAGLAVAAPKGTPKPERAARRSEGRAHGDALWACAMSALEETRAEREAAREAERAQREAELAEREAERAQRDAERAERQERRAERAEANAELLQQMMHGAAGRPAGGAPPLGSTTPSSGGDEARGGGKVNGSCCINGAFYACPSLDAVDKCSGAFMRCQGGCGFDMACIERCSQSHPLDPSMCDRTPARDGECK